MSDVINRLKSAIQELDSTGLEQAALAEIERLGDVLTRAQVGWGEDLKVLRAEIDRLRKVLQQIVDLGSAELARDIAQHALENMVKLEPIGHQRPPGKHSVMCYCGEPGCRGMLYPERAIRSRES